MRFSVTPLLGRRGAQPPARLRGTMKSGSTGQMRSSNPPPGCGGGCAGDPQASAWGLTARKSAVWAEGLADGAPWARPGHHQAASCGLRRCQELGLREFVWVVASLPWRRGGRHRQAARRKSVHRFAKPASRCRFGAFVYTVATREDRASDRGDSQECTQIGENGLSEPFWGTCVHCCDASFTMRITSGGTSTSTTMACRWRPLAGRLSPGREDRLCASGAAVRLASSPRQ